MKKNIILLSIFFILIGSSFVQGFSYSEFKENIYNNNILIKIQNSITDNNADWNADISCYEISSRYVSNYVLGIEEEFENNITYLSTLPDQFDWRNVNETNWITTVKNQGNCGSCTAFGTIGALESVVQIELGQTTDIDLSESDLYYCNGGDCVRGITIPNAAYYVSGTGVSDELCFPYTVLDGSCDDKKPNWNDRVIKAKTTKVQGVTGIKNAIYQFGAVVSSFIVFEDFYYYSSGVYKHVYGNSVGGHVITIVGWNDDPGYWICKNSWGSDWGEENPYSEQYEKGYFRIKYNECGIDSNAYYFYDFEGNIQPSKPINLKPANNQYNIDTSVNLSWKESNDIDGDYIIYNIYFNEGVNVDFDDILVQGLDDNYYIIENLKKDSYYSWFVVAEDYNGSQTISDKIFFKTRNPNAPEIKGPSRIISNRNITFTAYSSEDSIGDIYYWEFDWGDESNSTFGPYDKCNEIEASHSWKEKGNYVIGVRFQEDEIWSNWGYLDVRIFMTRSYQDFIVDFSKIIDVYAFLKYFIN